MKPTYSRNCPDYSYGTFQEPFASKDFLTMVEKWFKGTKMWSLVLFPGIQIKNVNYY